MSLLEKAKGAAMGSRLRDDKGFIALLRARLDYSAETGALYWKNCDLNPSRYRGKEAGYTHKREPYRLVKVLGAQYKAHRIVWALHYGEFPSGCIDHINGVEGDNRIENLRDCSDSINQKNRRKSKNNTSGVVGVVWHAGTGKWQAQIKTEGKSIYLGLFDDKIKACEARREAEQKYGFSKRHGVAA